MRIFLSLVGLLSLPLVALSMTACGGRPVTTGGAAPQQAGTTLTPNSPPICGEFARPYLAPGSTGMANPVMPPPGLGVLDERQSRMYVEGDLSNAYGQEDLNLIANGRARVGLDERAVYLANGLPAFYWNTQIADSRCRVLLYGILGEPNVDTAIYTCDNEIVHIGPVQPRLPCWRVEEVAPRAIEHAQHFDTAEVEQQWDILYGLLRRGQSMNDVAISFGVPYRTGTEAREDGTNAANHVYLDNTGDAYATYLTFVDRTLRGWRFPPDRRLTAEAEQRRLDAMERRMVDQMREMEEASIARHQAELDHLNNIQQNQEEIRTDIEDARTAVIDHVSDESAATRGTVRTQGAQTRGAINAQNQGGGAGNGGASSMGGGRAPSAMGGGRASGPVSCRVL
ncbi:MAG: hypothetical protein ACI9KE_005194, partial [Polyangiales bacterium]